MAHARTTEDSGAALPRCYPGAVPQIGGDVPHVRLTAKSIVNLKAADGKRTDFFDVLLPSFAMRVSPTGAKSYVLFYRRGRKLRRYTIGSYPDLSLSEARSKAREALNRVAHGEDPALDKQLERKAETFEELAALYLERWAKPRKRSWREDERLLRNKALPKLGKLPAGNVTRADVRALVEPLAEHAPIEANRLFACLRKLFNWARSADLVELSPCDGLSMPAPARQRDRVLTADELRKLWKHLDGESASTAAQFKLRLLTAQRGGEVLTMRWDDLDLDGAVWTIPAERSKNGLPHRVPLSEPALAVLAALSEARESSAWVFPGPDDSKPLASAQKAWERIRRGAELEDVATHDLRRTAASYMTSIGIPRFVVARSLNHQESGVTAVYDRHSYDREKREALDHWARELTRIVSGKWEKSAGAVVAFPVL